jgi:hypothetical protein
MIDPKVTWVIDPSDGLPDVDLHITVHIGPDCRKTGKAGLATSCLSFEDSLPPTCGG